jgi:hypothetical protein
MFTAAGSMSTTRVRIFGPGMHNDARLRRATAAALVALMVAAGRVTPVQAWGYAAHKFIMDRAIDLLPPEIRPFFQQYRTTLVEHAIDPDTYRTMGFAEEPPRHFLDMDAYGQAPFTALPHDYDEAVAKFGKEVVLKNGILPWRAQEIADHLRDAFKQTSPWARDDIKLFSAVLTHYISDAHQPFHAALNYDGQLTGQPGVHARFEAELFERYQSRLRITPRPVSIVENVRDFTFAALGGSFSQVDALLAADRAAAAGRTAYDDEYFEKFFERAQPVMEGRISAAITAAASVISSAWIQAGRPPLPAVAAPRPPRPFK